MKRTVYLDSTIPSYLYDQREEIKTFVDITKKWWKEESSYFLIWISEETLNEIYNGNYPNKGKIIKFTSKLKVLEPDKNIIEITRVYLKHYLMPQTQTGDAVHLAYASYYKMDFLLTWNCSHLANANKKDHIRRINAMMNLPTPEIITPLELFQEEKNDRSITFIR